MVGWKQDYSRISYDVTWGQGSVLRVKFYIVLLFYNGFYNRGELIHIRCIHSHFVSLLLLLTSVSYLQTNGSTAVQIKYNKKIKS